MNNHNTLSLNIREFNDLIDEIQNEVDPETGCKHNDNYEDCRQNYFLKQQNQILQQNNAPQSEGTITTEVQELREQLNQQQQEIALLKSEQQPTASTNNLYWIEPIFLSGWIVAGVVILSVFVVWKKKRV
jgi:phage-related minor tail protein